MPTHANILAALSIIIHSDKGTDACIAAKRSRRRRSGSGSDTPFLGGKPLDTCEDMDSFPRCERTNPTDHAAHCHPSFELVFPSHAYNAGPCGSSTASGGTRSSIGECPWISTSYDAPAASQIRRRNWLGHCMGW